MFSQFIPCSTPLDWMERLEGSRAAGSGMTSEVSFVEAEGARMARQNAPSQSFPRAPIECCTLHRIKELQNRILHPKSVRGDSPASRGPGPRMAAFTAARPVAVKDSKSHFQSQASIYLKPRAPHPAALRIIRGQGTGSGAGWDTTFLGVMVMLGVSCPHQRRTPFMHCIGQE